MALDPDDLSRTVLDFLAERHLATLTVLRPDGTPHVTPVGFTWDGDAGLVRVITWAGALKVRHLEAATTPRAVVCQVDGGRWLSLEGAARVVSDRERCADAERRYADRYSEPNERPDRRCIEIAVDRVLGRA